MKRNLHIIQINGIKGLLITICTVACLVAGFVIFPGFVLMALWNTIAGEFLPQLSVFSGVLLWGIVVTSYLILRKKSFSVSFGTPPELTEEELRRVIERAQAEAQNKMLNSFEFKTPEEKIEKKEEEITK